MNKNLTLLGAALLVAAPVTAMAEIVPGPYGTLAVGANFLEDVTPNNYALSATTSFKTGWLGDAAIGYEFPSGVRGELEIGYRRSDVDSTGAGVGGGGRSGTWDAMANLLYDISACPSSRISVPVSVSPMCACRASTSPSTTPR
jgi:hypothetical protein